MPDRRINPRKAKIRWRVVLPTSALLLGLLVAGHAAWRWQAGRALDADIQSLRASGERVLPGDFGTPEPKWRDNAAPYLTAAAAIIDDGSEAARSISWAPATFPVNPRAWPYLVRAKAWFEPALRRI